MNGKSDELLVALNVSPGLEEPVVDWLLSREDGSGFTSFAAFGHSSAHDGLSAAEQVAGRQRRHQFQVLIPAGSLEPFLAALNDSFGAADIRYWVLPVLASGP